ncbi:MAG: cytochrome P460 family protein [Burkholderiaceae bacterium]
MNRSTRPPRRSLLRPLAAGMALLVLAACSSGPHGGDMARTRMAAADPVVAPGLVDGEIAVPAGYRQWPRFLVGIDKVEGKQIRDIYISPRGHKTEPGQAFPDGTISVMEIWKPKSNADGTLVQNAEGKLVKDSLSLVFVMAKSPGAGAKVAPEMRTGDWVYAGYAADGATPAGPAAAACRGCHLTQPDNDWVFRYDEYFSKRGS